MNIQQYTKEIKTHLDGVAGDIPLHRRQSRYVYSFSKFPLEEQLAIWDHVWQTHGGFYSRLHATFFLERHFKKESALRLFWPVIVRWQDQVNDWGLCDALAKVYTRTLEIMPIEVYEVLVGWNSDANLWKRRQSLVSLLYYSRTKKQFLSFGQVTALITPLLQDKEYYVQKAVGWALRELHNVYPEQAFAYLQHNGKAIGSGAFTTAMEKMSAEKVEELRTLRRA